MYFYPQIGVQTRRIWEGQKLYRLDLGNADEAGTSFEIFRYLRVLTLNRLRSS